MTSTDEDTFNYQLLARLQQDCEYFLGCGNRDVKRLWAGNVAEQIQKMKDLYAGFHEKPEWIALATIEQYEAAMVGDKVAEAAATNSRAQSGTV